MFYLTKHEKSVLVALAVIVLCGSIINIVFKRQERLTGWIEEKEHFLHKTDVNRASFDQLVRVPYIGEKSAKRVLEHREKFGKIKSLAELGLITRLSESSLEKAGQYLEFGR